MTLEEAEVEIERLRLHLTRILELADGMQLARHDASRDRLHVIARLAKAGLNE
jgi:hypothetical protein